MGVTERAFLVVMLVVGICLVYGQDQTNVRTSTTASANTDPSIKDGEDIADESASLPPLPDPAENLQPISVKQISQRMQNGDEGVVVIVGPQCPSCVHALTQVGQIASFWPQSKRKLFFSVLDLGNETEEDNVYFFNNHKISSVPSVLLIREGFSKEYLGQRGSNLLFKYLDSLSLPAIKKIVNKSDFKQFKKSEEVRVLGYYPAESDQADLDAFQRVAKHYQGDIPFYLLTDSKIAKSEFKINRFPTIQIHRPAERHVELKSTSDAPFQNSSEIIDFIFSNRHPIWSELRTDNVHRVWDSSRVACIAVLYPSSDWLSSNRGEAARIGQGTVEKTADSDWDIDSRKFLSVFKTIAKNMARSRRLNFVVLNGATYPEVLKAYQMQLSDLPTMALFDHENNRDAFLNKTLVKVSVAGLEEWIEEFLEGRVEAQRLRRSGVREVEGPVKIVDQSSFKTQVIDDERSVLVEFYTQKCADCKKLEPVYQELARDVAARGEDAGVVIASYDSGVNAVPEGLELKSHPTIYLFKAGSKDKPILYEGGLGKSDLVTFLASQSVFGGNGATTPPATEEDQESGSKPVDVKE